MTSEQPPTYAIIKVKKIIFSGERIDHVVAEISYPRISIKHKMRITRDELVQFILARERVRYNGIPWTLGTNGLILPPEKQVISPTN